MKPLKLILLTCIICALSGCFTVKTIDNPEDIDCGLVTKELEINFSEDLSNVYLRSNQGANPQTSEAALLLLVAVPATSFIVSGSVSVLGNVVHWVEKQGKCETGTVRTFTSNLNDSVVAAGGMIVDTSESFLNWMQGK